MTTKTDFHAVQELRLKYVPAARGILSNAERAVIDDVLEIPSRNDIELQNVRDSLVMLYGQWAEHAQLSGDFANAAVLMDAMSGACAAIDHEKSRRGLPV